jgi:hypothetical protein
MRMLLTASMDVEVGNAAVKDGTLGPKMQQILADMKPEAAYFATKDGRRTAFVVFDMTDSSQLPAIAEPWFLAFNASISVEPTMTPADLAAGGPGFANAINKYGKS